MSGNTDINYPAKSRGISPDTADIADEAVGRVGYKIRRYSARLSRIIVLLFNTLHDNKAQVYSRKTGGDLYLSKKEISNIFPRADRHE